MASEFPHQSDGELLKATRHGTGAAFALFYRRPLPAVIRLLLRETRNREVTAEITSGMVRAAWAKRQWVAASWRCYCQ
jgi:hypothetical protein